MAKPVTPEAKPLLGVTGGLLLILSVLLILRGSRVIAIDADWLIGFATATFVVFCQAIRIQADTTPKE